MAAEKAGTVGKASRGRKAGMAPVQVAVAQDHAKVRVKVSSDSLFRPLNLSPAGIIPILAASSLILIHSPMSAFPKLSILKVDLFHHLCVIIQC